jgi:GntR family transcriptional regulator/MocR family aminotransferase
VLEDVSVVPETSWDPLGVIHLVTITGSEPQHYHPAIDARNSSWTVDRSPVPIAATLPRPFIGCLCPPGQVDWRWRGAVPKRALPVDRPEIRLDAKLPTPLYRQLYGRLRGAILTGQLRRGERVPSTRTLARELGVSRFTIVAAYDLLVLEGYLESRVGQGTVVSRQLPVSPFNDPKGGSPELQTEAREPSPVRLAALVHSIHEVPHLARLEGSRGEPFVGGQPALDLFPYDLWARLVARRARRSLRAHAYYQSPAGYAPLREAIAAHIGITRGVRCTPEQIIVTAGTQGALDLAVRTLLDPGDSAWIENPGYFGARGALRRAGVHVIPVPVDAKGLDVEAGQQRAPEARLAFVTPSHQYPTGVTLSLGRRLALLDWASRTSAWILEDDYDSEYRYGGRPLEALQALDQDERVIYIGTFSKLLFPALRLGYLVAPRALVAPLLATRRFLDVHMPILEQMALADFLSEGHYARHIRRMVQHYRRRRDCLYHELSTTLDGLLDISVPEAGLELVGWLPPGVDDRRAVDLAGMMGVKVVAISRQSLEPLPRGGLLFGFAGIDEEAMRRGVKTLAEALEPL